MAGTLTANLQGEIRATDPSVPELPRLREDLELLPGPKSRDGAPTWTVYDPARNRYFRISQAAFELLKHWHLGDWIKITDAVAQTSGYRPKDNERDWMVRFLNINMLIQRGSPSDIADLKQVGQAAKTSKISWALHNYLFFRIPVVRPQRFLDATLPVAHLLVSRTALVLGVLITLMGAYLTARQWDSYVTTFLHFSNAEGLLWYGLAIVLAKILHELGHAYTAAYYGCRVPTMGIAFLVMWPVLYTDTSDAWRLTHKRQRIAIGSAGMLTELALAVFATLLWSFLPDGPLRSAAFIVATVTWIMTLAVNLNPFMRFDGYYLLSDALEIENLQDRSFAYARWWLRERLFGFGEVPPEVFSEKLRRFLLAYAFATWVYRFFLFLGIAILVYVFFFKLLGLFLFIIELAWFIALPIARESVEWWKRRGSFRLNRNLVTTSLLLALGIGVLVVPWQTTIAIPAVLQAAERAYVYAPLSAQVLAVHAVRGDTISQDEILLTLNSPELNHKITQTRLRIELKRLQISREAAGGTEAENISILRRRLESELTSLRGLEEQRALLTVRAPLNGRIVDFNGDLRKGLWIAETQPLAQIVASDNAQLDGFVDERELPSVHTDTLATFYPDDISRSVIHARLTTVAEVNSSNLDIPYLASIYGGDIPVKKGRGDTLVPTQGIYRLSLTPEHTINSPSMVQRGTVHIESTPQSLILRIWNRVWGVLVRESGF